MTMEVGPDHALTIMKEAWKFGRTFDKVDVSATDGRIILTVHGTGKADEARLREAKKRLGDHLMGVFPKRKFLHEKQRGFSVWRWGHGVYSTRSDGFKAGIRIKLVEPEETQLLLGNWYSRQRWSQQA
jgi:hypothetical protein